MPNQSPLTPIRHQPSFFSLDISSIGLKDQIQSMEHPIFSLSKKPDTQTRHYANRHGNKLTVTPSGLGLPTIWDKDILVFAISKIIDARKRGEEVGPTVRFHIADVIEFGQMIRCGPTYRRLDNALRRLAGCTLETNIRTGNEETTDIFHIIDRATIKRQYNRIDGRLEYVEFTLSDWLWRAIEAREVLTLHPDYFRLRQALARRLYEIARKHCGHKAEWLVSLELLHQKSGSKMNLRQFRHTIRKLAATGDLLDYDMQLAAGRSSEVVRFQLRKDSRLSKPPAGDPGGIRLSESALRQASEIIGTAGKLSAAEADFRAWVQKKGVIARHPDRLFLAFCESWLQQAGLAPADTKLSFREELALEWWRSLTEDERGDRSQAIGIRTEIGGTPYVRDELALARQAFNNRWPPHCSDPAAVEFPPVLLERLAGEIESSDVTIMALTAAWRTYAPADNILRQINDPVISLWLFAQDVVKGEPPDVMQAVNKATEIEEELTDSQRYAEYHDKIKEWKDRAVVWWKTLPAAKQIEAVAAHGPDPALITFIERHRMGVGVEEMIAARVYAASEPPPEFEGGVYAAFKAIQLHDSWLSDEGFREYHDIDDDLVAWDDIC